MSVQRPGKKYFYQNENLVVQTGSDTVRLLRGGSKLLAEMWSADSIRAHLLQTDRVNSVLNTKYLVGVCAYTVYGFNARKPEGFISGFNGQLLDQLMLCYHPGAGKRVYRPELAIFSRPDPLSPFGKGEKNSYAYCERDPVNFYDPSGLTRLTLIPPPARHSRRPSLPIVLRSDRKLPLRRHSLSGPSTDVDAPRLLDDRARYINDQQLNTVRHVDGQQVNKQLPSYTEAMDPRGLKAFNFADDVQNTNPSTSTRVVYGNNITIIRRTEVRWQRTSTGADIAVLHQGVPMLMLGPRPLRQRTAHNLLN